MSAMPPLPLSLAFIAIVDCIGGFVAGLMVLRGVVRGDLGPEWPFLIFGILITALAMLAVASSFGLFSRTAFGWRLALGFHSLVPILILLLYLGAVYAQMATWGDSFRGSVYGGTAISLVITSVVFAILGVVTIFPVILIHRTMIRTAFLSR